MQVSLLTDDEYEWRRSSYQFAENSSYDFPQSNQLYLYIGDRFQGIISSLEIKSGYETFDLDEVTGK